MKRIFTIALIVIGVVFLTGGAYTVSRGLDAKSQVRAELLRQDITTPDDASIPGVKVQDAQTAQVMADVINKHVTEVTGGESYAELGRFLAKDGGDTSDEAQALKDDQGNPVANPVRDVAFTASALRTGLYTSVMAFNLADLVIGIGVAFAALGFVVAGLGVVLAGLVGATVPVLARKPRVEPVPIEG